MLYFGNVQELAVGDKIDEVLSVFQAAFLALLPFQALIYIFAM